MKFKTSHIWTLASLERELRLIGGWGALTSEQRQAFDVCRLRLDAAALENMLEGATNFADNCRLAADEIERGLATVTVNRGAS